MRLAPFIFILAFAGVARADGNDGLVVVDRGDRVDVIVRGAVAASGPANAVGDRVEIPLADLPLSPMSLRSADSTVGKVELLAGPKPRLSIALHHGRETTAKIANAAEIVTAAEGFRVTLLRSSALKSYVKPPEPALASAPAIETKPIEPPAPVPAPAPVAVPVPAPAAAAVPAPAAAPAPVASAPPAQASAPILGAQSSSDMSPLRIAALAIGLGACAVVLFVARRRRGNAPGDQIRVLASQSLGGKHRVVLVSAGKREFLLALSEKDTRVIGRWRKPAAARATADEPIEVPSRTGLLSAMERPAAIPAALPPASPAVAGLLKLRKTSPSPAGTPQNDLEWAARLARARTAAGADS